MGVGQPRILGEVGGLVVAEDGPRVLVVDRGNGPPAVLAFVAGVIAGVCGGFGAAGLAATAAGRGWGLPVELCAGLLVVGVAAAVVAAETLRRNRRRRSIPVSRYRPVAVFDRSDGLYRDGDGAVLARIDAVTLHRRMQWGSSSASLVARTPTGMHVLLRGNPFTGGLGDLDTVLKDAISGPHLRHHGGR